MIFVTIGMMYKFDRLIKAMDYVAGKIDEEIIMQIGKTSYVPKNAKYFRFIPEKDIKSLYINARVVVCHAGVGSILTALHYNKPVIVVPRKKIEGEHVDNHQFEIARELEQEGQIKVVYDVEEIEKTLNNPIISTMEIEKDRGLIERLKKYINGLAH
jgi:UDP-N-acetylglucosamine transferase subunit ALG13